MSAASPSKGNPRSTEQVRTGTGPAVLSYGFRPFFLGGAMWAAAVIAVWLPVLHGGLALPTHLAPVDWHAHELVFGFVPAIVAGFLLTAVPNWTGRLPVTGRPLLALALTWLSGRVAILLSDHIGLAASAAVDLAFLAALVAVAGREVQAGGNTRNLKVVGVVALVLVGNVVFHAELLLGGGAGHGVRLGIAATVALIMIIGGRVIPSFTTNWLARQGSPARPAPPDKTDIRIVGASAVALASWVVTPGSQVTALLCLAAGVLNVYRLSRWHGHLTAREPLVAILHVAYAFVPLGFLLVAAAAAWPAAVSPSGALHGWTAGGIGVLTLAIMTRASLGHTGRPLAATRPILVIYAAVVLAALARVAAAFDILREPLLYLSVVAWVVAFGGFAVVYWPLLTRPRA